MSALPDGLYDRLLTREILEEVQALLHEDRASGREIHAEERRRRLADLVAGELVGLLDGLKGEDDARATAELAIVTRVLAGLRQALPGEMAPVLPLPARVLTAVHRRTPRPTPPVTGLAEAWLFTAGRSDPALLEELRRELASADQVDVLVSFILWSGVRKLQDILQSTSAVGADGRSRRRMRILTTTYTGATEERALAYLAGLPGVEVRVSLDPRRSRLHAKAWIFRRESGYGSAYVGSANLSHSAMAGGIEWTVKFTQAADPGLYKAANAHFETLWNDPEFAAFDPADPATVEGFRRASRSACSPEAAGTTTVFDLQPKAYQAVMLERLAAERRHGRMRNLLVAATGTGKTVVAAFDYARTARELGSAPRLLYIAHRVEILRQARDTFRQVLRQPDFGGLLGGGSDPDGFDHCFATIESVAARRLTETLGADHWHTVVVDECHHLPAARFDAVVTALRPKVLLGLTATPERADGKRLDAYFDARPDGSPAVELRLWDALDQQLLAPFEYYGCNDEGTDLREVPWDSRGAEAAALDRLLTGNHARARLVVNELRRLHPDPARMRALAFCVSVAHAEFMADSFNAAGIPALCVAGATDAGVRRDAPQRLARRELNVLVTCDLYNEGVDFPDVDTLLLLRPTQSPVVFQQQLGRGLRLAPDKESCLVLDFVGRHREEFRFDRLLGVLSGLSRRALIEQVERGFSGLPPGCHIQLDRVVRERVLEGLKQVSRQRWSRLAGELTALSTRPGFADPRMADFLREQCLSLEDLYRDHGPSGWTALRRAAGMERGEAQPGEEELARRFRFLLHADDPARLALWARVAEVPADAWDRMDAAERRRVLMLAHQLFGSVQDRCGGADLLRRLQEHPRVKDELGQLVNWLDNLSDLPDRPLPGAPGAWPLVLHAAYERREILTAIGHMQEGKPLLSQEGVIRLMEERIEVHLVTLDKSEGFHQAIAYRDYAISPELFHWQTQNAAGPETPAGRRYLESPDNGWTFQLFVRVNKDEPYRSLGPGVRETAEGAKPMSITWRLAVPMPLDLFKRYSVVRR